jgi:hypothetical protein
VEAGHQDPQRGQNGEDQERVVDPQPAPRINAHANACSVEQAFVCKARPRHKAVTSLALTAAVALLAGCLADPQKLQSLDLLDRLTSARVMLAERQPSADKACTMVGDVQTRLYGEPGLVEVQPAWTALRDAASALNAVCGQSTLLALPSNDSPVLVQARARWQQGIQREMGVACDHLREAAAALRRPAPC